MLQVAMVMSTPGAPPGGAVTCVLFDLYGTLLHIRLDEDSPALWTGLTRFLRPPDGSRGPAEIRARFLAILDEEARIRAEGFIMEAAFRRLLASVGSDQDVASLGREFRRLSLRQSVLAEFVTPLFRALHHAGTATAIVSNTEAVLTSFDLDAHPVLREVDTTVLSSEVGVRKPAPAIFHIALRRLGASPETTVVVGNSLTDDMAGARAAGLGGVYLPETAADAALAAPDGVEVVRPPATLPPIIEALQRLGWTGRC